MAFIQYVVCPLKEWMHQLIQGDSDQGAGGEHVDGAECKKGNVGHRGEDEE